MGIADLRILLIEDSEEDAELFQAGLRDCPGRIVSEHANMLSLGLKLIEKKRYDLVFLDLGLPDSEGVAALQEILTVSPTLPIIILTGLQDEKMALRAISLGAQDYLIKGSFKSDLLYRSILYAIERKKAQNFSQALNRINALIHSKLDIDSILKEILTEASLAMGCETASISLNEDTGCIVKSVFGLPEEAVGIRLSTEEETQAMLAVRTRKPVAIADAFTDYRTRNEHMKKCNIRSVMIVPLVVEDHVNGVILFNYHKSIVNFQEIHLDFGSKMAALASMAMQKAMLLGKIQAELEQRERAEEALIRARDELEVNVTERTAELAVVNTELLAEVQECKRAEDESNKSLGQVQQLAAHLQTAREEERTNIAREIHDELGQALTALKIDLSLMASNLSKNNGLDVLAKQLYTDIDLIDSTILSVKRICTRLRPAILDHLGLDAAVQWQIEEFMKRTGVRCLLTSELENVVLENYISTAIFRILQETLTNVMRHAEATMVNVHLSKRDESLLLTVQDNGKGYAEASLADNKSFGLVGIQERVRSLNGSFNISGLKGLGTTVSIIIPISKVLSDSVK